MRWAAILASCVILQAQDVASLRTLADNHRMFDLRRSLEHSSLSPADTLFFRAICTSVFGQETTGIELLRQVLQSHPTPEIARRANEELASAFERLFLYRQASEAWAEALRFTPGHDSERGGTDNSRLLEESLSDIPPETVDFGPDVPIHAVRNRVGSWDVPVQIGSRTGRWIFDTGGNFSTLSESEARRMGLSILESQAYVNGATGKKNPLRIAVAKEIRFGSARIHNVVFLVLSDQSLYIGPIHYQLTGILGLPALRALERVSISSSGNVEIRPPTADHNGAPDLFFEEQTPILEVGHGGHLLQVFVDTGANSTALYPSFRSALTVDETRRLRKKREKTGGAGGIVHRTAEIIPRVPIEIGGSPVTLNNVDLLPKQPADIRFRDGVIGMDALWGGFTIDFHAMRLTVP